MLRFRVFLLSARFFLVERDDLTTSTTRVSAVIGGGRRAQLPMEQHPSSDHYGFHHVPASPSHREVLDEEAYYYGGSQQRPLRAARRSANYYDEERPMVEQEASIYSRGNQPAPRRVRFDLPAAGSRHQDSSSRSAGRPASHHSPNPPAAVRRPVVRSPERRHPLEKGDYHALFFDLLDDAEYAALQQVAPFFVREDCRLSEEDQDALMHEHGITDVEINEYKATCAEMQSSAPSSPASESRFRVYLRMFGGLLHPDEAERMLELEKIWVEQCRERADWSQSSESDDSLPEEQAVGNYEALLQGQILQLELAFGAQLLASGNLLASNSEMQQQMLQLLERARRKVDAAQGFLPVEDLADLLENEQICARQPDLETLRFEILELCVTSQRRLDEHAAAIEESEAAPSLSRSEKVGWLMLILAMIVVVFGSFFAVWWNCWQQPRSRAKKALRRAQWEEQEESASTSYASSSIINNHIKSNTERKSSEIDNDSIYYGTVDKI